MMLTFWVIWRHRWHGHSLAIYGCYIGGQLEPTLYLVRFMRHIKPQTKNASDCHWSNYSSCIVFSYIRRGRNWISAIRSTETENPIPENHTWSVSDESMRGWEVGSDIIVLVFATLDLAEARPQGLHCVSRRSSVTWHVLARILTRGNQPCTNKRHYTQQAANANFSPLKLYLWLILCLRINLNLSGECY